MFRRSGELQLTGYMACREEGGLRKDVERLAAKKVTLTRAVSGQRSGACSKVVAVVEWMKRNPD